jgi:acyl carrier protein
MMHSETSRSDILERLTPIFRQCFMDDSVEATNDLTADDVDHWTSLNHIKMVVAVENDFSIRFSRAEVANLIDVREFVELIKARLDRPAAAG